MNAVEDNTLQFGAEAATGASAEALTRAETSAANGRSAGLGSRVAGGNLTVQAGTPAAVVDLADGNDIVRILLDEAIINADIALGAGNDRFEITSGQISRSQNRLLLEGFDRLQVVVDADAGGQIHARFGLGGNWSSRRSALTWTADYVYRPDTLSAQVLNTDGFNTIDWTGATASLQWSLGWQRALGSNSRIHFSATGKTDMNADSAGAENYRLQLGFSHRL